MALMKLPQMPVLYFLPLALAVIIILFSEYLLFSLPHDRRTSIEHVN
jgi:hypothetical protein